MARRLDPFERQRGSMLILALIIVFLMTVLVSDITEVSMVEYEASVNVGNIARLEYGLNAGLEVAKAYLVQDAMDTDVDSLADAWAQPIKQTMGGESAQSVKERASGERPGAVDVTIEMEDEESKWPLSLLVVGNDAQIRRRRELLGAVIDSFRESAGGSWDLDRGTAERYAEAIAGFLARKENEAGPVPRPDTKSPIHILNVADLSLIKDIDDRILFDEVDEQGNIVPGLLRYLTIWSDMKINVNTAQLPVLRGLFRPEDRIRADDILNHRNAQTEEKEKKKKGIEGRLEEKTKGKEEEEDKSGGAIFEKVQDVQKIEGFSPRVFNEAQNFMTVNSRTFSVWVTAELGAMSRTRHWVLRRENGRIIMMLSEAIDQDFRPRFRKARPDEEPSARGPR
jgi:type II secretory pathway component PulK